MHWSWLLVAFLLYWFYVSNGGSPYAFVFLYGVVFGIVTLHEFGHALACRSVGGQADTIVLWPLGGVAYVSPPVRPGAVLWSIVAGPLVNLALVPLLGLLWFLMSLMSSMTGVGGFYTIGMWIFVANLFMFIFNMLPIYPLDGGQILQSILWFFVGRARSTLIASWIGVAGGGVMVAAALVLLMVDATDSYMLLAVAIFILIQAYHGVQVARYLAAHEREGESIRSSWKPVHPHEVKPRVRRIDSVSRPVNER